MDIKYMTIDYNELLDIINDGTNAGFFDEYFKNFHWGTVEKFKKSNNKTIEFYQKYDKNAETYFHVLIDLKTNKLIAIERSLEISDVFFSIKYFVPLKKKVKLSSKLNIMYNTKLFVDPNYRGKHVCGRLLEEINKYADKNNIKYIIAEIHQDNTPSIKCHIRNNFVKTDILSYENTYFFVNLIKKEKKTIQREKREKHNNSIQRTVFIAEFGDVVERHFKELLEIRNFKITKEWSPKKEEHFIMTKTGKNINWDTIKNECKLLNHVPFSKLLCQKKLLADLVQQNEHLFRYYPYSFNNDVDKNLTKYEKYKTPNFGEDLWIIKPNMLYGGTGIKIVNRKDLSKYDDSKYVIQKYLEKPLLLKDHKFDFRMYVVFTPDKKLYIHSLYEVRIAQTKHTLDISTMDPHLTNLTYQEKHGYDTSGKRLRGSEFEREFYTEYNFDLQLIQKVSKILKDTFKTLTNEIKKMETQQFYELYGIDVVYDKDLNPYILEFNYNPDFTLAGANYDFHHGIIDDVFSITVDKVFDNADTKNISHRLIEIWDINKEDIENTAFVGQYPPVALKHYVDLLTDRGFTITKEWSPKKENHMIMNKTAATIKWDTINDECELLNHIPMSQTYCNKKDLSAFVNKNPFLFKHYPYSFSDNVKTNIKRYNKYRSKNFGTDLWIIKPAKTWGGVGIRLARTAELYKHRNEKMIVQKYLEHPMLLNGYKFDYRLYVIVSPDKKIFIHPFYEVRIAHAKYNMDDISNMDAHLTNLSYQSDKGYDVDDKRLTKYEFEKIRDDIDIISKISKAIISTFDADSGRFHAMKINRFYELYGVDVILDKDSNPYILEYNDNPGFSKGDSKNYEMHHKLLNDIYILTIDRVFYNAIFRDSFPRALLLRDYSSRDHDFQNEIEKTAFLGNLGIAKEKIYIELLGRRNFKIVKEWSPQRKGHFIATRSVHTIKWDTIINDCELFNHVPFSMNICRKKLLIELLYKNTHLYKYYPYSFFDNVKTNLQKYKKYMTNNLGDKLWIVKPSKGTGGEGIKFVKIDELKTYDGTDFIIQKYIEHPLLLNGYKFDFRVYVIFTPNKQLYVHSYYEVKFTHSKYDVNDISSMDGHLTNLTYQREAGYDIADKRLNKYDFEPLFKKEYGYDINFTSRIVDAIRKTFDAVREMIDKMENNNFFELFGADIILDKDMNPYILEFNHHPGFGLGIGDYKHHEQLIDDVFSITVDRIFKLKKQSDNVSSNLIKIFDYNVISGGGLSNNHQNIYLTNKYKYKNIAVSN